MSFHGFVDQDTQSRWAPRETELVEDTAFDAPVDLNRLRGRFLCPICGGRDRSEEAHNQQGLGDCRKLIAGFTEREMEQ